MIYPAWMRPIEFGNILGLAVNNFWSRWILVKMEQSVWIKLNVIFLLEHSQLNRVISLQKCVVYKYRLSRASRRLLIWKVLDSSAEENRWSILSFCLFLHSASSFAMSRSPFSSMYIAIVLLVLFQWTSAYPWDGLWNGLGDQVSFGFFRFDSIRSLSSRLMVAPFATTTPVATKFALYCWHASYSTT